MIRLKIFDFQKIENIENNLHAVGTAVVQPLGLKNDFLRNPFFGSAAWFFVIILKFILIANFEIKVHIKNSLAPKKMIFLCVKEFFSWIWISKMGVKMNFRIISKNHAADSKIGSPQKSILEPMGLTSLIRKPES